MIKKIEHIAIRAFNMDESIRFYTEVLGMQLVERVALDDKVELAFLSFEGQESAQVELIGNDSPIPEEGLVNHLAFTVTDLEAAMERLIQAGIEFAQEWPKVILNNRKIAFFKGPSGEKLELFQYID